MSTRMAPCNWPVSYDALAQGASASPAQQQFSSLAPAVKTIYEQMATALLWRWTGRSLGTCQVTIRPCSVDCNPGLSTFNGFGPTTNAGYGAPFRPVIINGLWYNITCGSSSCGDNGCTCSPTDAPPLRIPGPVDSILYVQQDTLTIPASGGVYRVDNKNLLVRMDGQPWPKCQSLDTPLGQPGTFGITYMMGVPVPPGGDVVAGLLALELWKASTGDPDCGLPKRIQSVSRQGVNVVMMDKFDVMKEGGTGIWIIDAWLQSLMQPPQRARVFSPDMKRSRRQTF